MKDISLLLNIHGPVTFLLHSALGLACYVKQRTAQGCPSWWDPDRPLDHRCGLAEGKGSTSTGPRAIAHLLLAGCKDAKRAKLIDLLWQYYFPVCLDFKLMKY